MRIILFFWLIIGWGLAGYASAQVVGMQSIAIANPERAANINALVWYPTKASESQVLIGDNAVFRGTAAFRDGPILDGRFPLVIIAHGGFRSSPHSVNWLASTLAGNGYIVAVVNPPKLPMGPASQKILDEFWQRPGDLSATIAALISEKTFSKHLVPDRVGAIGFFLGGYTTLALAGARVDQTGFTNACQGDRQRFDCAWFAQGGVDLSRFDSDRLGKSYRETNLLTTVVIDPEWMHLFSSASLEAIDRPVHFINTGPWAASGSPLNASAVAEILPKAHYTTIKPAGKYSSFAECKPKGVFILQEEGADSRLCDDGPESPTRAETHQRLINAILGILDQDLK